MVKIRRALISVSDKAGLLEFVRALHALGVEIVSTGGTARAIRDAGLPVIEISKFTGFPEMLDGRVKTLHPKVHGGLLFIRGNAEHEAIAAKHGILPIDLVVVNLYPFEKTIARPLVTLHDAIENIDIGGPSMLRSAAKNHASVTAIVDPVDYAPVLAEMKANDGATLPATRARLAVKVFATTSRYDGAIAGYLGKGDGLPDTLTLSLPKVQALRYGENPHQKAALYGDFGKFFRQLHGKELSYNNIIDLTSAAELVREFAGHLPTVVILKHTNPCGVATALTLPAAWELAYKTDKKAPYGGIIAVNQVLDGPTAGAIAEIFSEVIVAYGFSPEALEILQKKKNLRLIEVLSNAFDRLYTRSVLGGVLAQERDTKLFDEAVSPKPQTFRFPTGAERRAMEFGWAVVKHVKSNAIVFVGTSDASVQTLGIGAGQMSRLDSIKIAIRKAKEAGLDLRGSVMASDAFLPFADNVIAAAEAGASVIIQPGGSNRDLEVIDAANAHDMAMVFTGIRHFKH